MGKMLDTLQTYLQTATPEELQEMYNSLKCWIPTEKSVEEAEFDQAVMTINSIKTWWKSSTGKDIPKGWDSSKEECLDFITRDSYATGFNKAKELYISKAKEAALKAYCKRCQDMGGGYPCSHKCYEYLEFEKTLEE